jgi:hypothetical protein
MKSTNRIAEIELPNIPSVTALVSQCGRESRVWPVKYITRKTIERRTINSNGPYPLKGLFSNDST